MADSQRPWRCFVAVPIGPELRAAVDACVRELRSRSDASNWGWTDPEGWHVTLAFLGPTDPVAVPRLAAALAGIAAAHDAFALEAGGLGAFPSRRQARVLWFGIADPQGRLRRLATAVRSATGVEDDERFRGHLTLARARGRDGTDAGGLVGAATAAPAPLDVACLGLYRSHLGRGPARYEELASSPLRGVTR